jgi:hydroxymethylbilane synthase
MKALDNVSARLETTAERSLLRRIEGGCQVPLGALARVEGDQLRLFSQVCALDGSKRITAEGACALSVADATALGQRIAEELLGKGAAEIIAIERGSKRGVAPA